MLQLGSNPVYLKCQLSTVKYGLLEWILLHLKIGLRTLASRNEILENCW